jgi:hypothetical protein
MGVVLPFVRRFTPQADGQCTGLGVSVATVVSARPSRLLKASIVAGTASIYDCATLADVGPGCLFYTGTATGHPVILDWPCLRGVVVVPVDGVASVVYSEL